MRYRKNFKIIIFFLCSLLVFLISKKVYQLKILGYQLIPKPGVILAEYDFAWLGKSIFTSGIPTAWSDLGAYSGEIKGEFSLKIDGFSISANGERPKLSNWRSFPKPLLKVETLDYGKGLMQVRFVQPYLDHPPLAGLIYALGVNKEAQSFEDVKASQFRLPNIWLSYLTGILIFLLGTQLAGPFIGLLAFVFYNTVPSFVFTSKLSLAENVLIPLFLASVNFLWLSKKYNKLIFSLIAGLLAGLAALTKLSGWSVLLGGFFCLLYWKKTKKEILTFLLSGILIGSLYFLYGWWLSGSLFLKVLLNQSSRFFWGPMGFFQQISRVNLIHFPLDGWWLGGFVILIWLSSFKENHDFLLPPLTYLLSIIFLGGGNYAWYYFPFIPFLVLGVSLLMKRLLIRPGMIDLILFFLFPFSSSFYWGFSVFHPKWPCQWFYRGLIVIFGLIIFFFIPKMKKRESLRLIWMIFSLFLIHRLYLWSFHSTLYLLENWEKLQPPLIF